MSERKCVKFCTPKVNKPESKLGYPIYLGEFKKKLFS